MRSLDTRGLMRDERRDLRDLLQSLTPEQWSCDSLCAGWTVRELVVHLVGWDDLLLYRTPREHRRALMRFSTLFATSLGSMTRFNRRLQRRVGELGPAELLRRFEADDAPDLKWLFDRTNPGAHLAEYVIHHQDIRRPLGLAREIPPERLVAALNGVTKLPDVRLSAWRRLRRRRWEATDVDWQRGRGSIVRAPGEAILMALAGRTAAIDELAEAT